MGLKQELKHLALAMFRKDFVGIFHGSISAKIDTHSFLINKREAIFDDLCDDSLIELDFSMDYRWKSASVDARIHQSIYQNILDAKFVSYTMPPFTTSYAINNRTIKPVDYFGSINIGEIIIYDPKHFEDWYERAHTEIYKRFIEREDSLLVIRGYGVYVYGRNIDLMIKKIAILENSCKILMLSSKNAGLQTQCLL